METQRRFVRGILILSALAFVFFTLEFVAEWVRLGRESRPGCRLVESQEPRLWVAMARLHSAAAGAATRSWCS